MFSGAWHGGGTLATGSFRAGHPQQIGCRPPHGRARTGVRAARGIGQGDEGLTECVALAAHRTKTLPDWVCKGVQTAPLAPGPRTCAGQ